ncbi:hypothetical protein AB0M97_29940 [Streptomyces sp. NPDC051207]|uniref:hypothetical protein n=1 Tax=Streptomyces sp. NPDC051207 TaxID=3154641 RepID=UPI0034275C2A
MLGTHWGQGLDPDPTPVGPVPRAGRPPAPPDRTEGTVLRFGPGVTAAVAQRTHRTFPAVPPRRTSPARHRGLRRNALPALVVFAVLALLAWQRLGPSVAVRGVSVTARPAALGCDTTTDITAHVTTDGRPGTLTYRWTRSDGTDSGVLREVLSRGQKQARLHLLWTFRGSGHHTARAELRILTPAPHTATARITYACP